ncbi:iron uptake porin [Myxosarcina sp. GI1]|uniref:iron uptake porin n=1 Tax=Myxosarcina sp. GI1 TaxID=1541065 RepID=UPI00056D3DC9|nr:iron uptake porin [Myxosarcina sp. GI1]
MNLLGLFLRLGGTVFGFLLMLTNVAYGQEITEDLLDSSDPLSQLTNVSELKDVAPTDWAYEALRGLVERYGCIAGYPDQTFRGSQALTRYEFAAGLNSCLNQIERLIAQTETISRDDLDTLSRLSQEFEAELATIGGRVDNLEARTAFLEDNQFSTTTKLVGQALFAVAGAFGDEKADSDDSVDDEIFFSERVRLVLDSSFSGRDLLRVRLQAGNTPDLSDATGTRMARLSFTSPTDNQFTVNQLEYRFPIGDKGQVFVEAFGFLDLFAPTLNPVDGDYDTTISGFSLRSPIYFQSGLSGVGFQYDVTESINVSGGYLGGDPTANNPNSGLFNGPYGALAQLTLYPTESFAFALTYLRGYDDGSANAPAGGFFGSENATTPFGEDVAAIPPETGEEASVPASVPVAYNSYGVETQYTLSPNIVLGGWAGLTQATAKGGVNDGADADILYWAVVLSFPDLGKEGNLGGLVFGQPSKVIDNEVDEFEDEDTSYAIEAFYRYQLNDNINITPGLLVITNPEHNEDNSTDYIGLIRTVFAF